MSGMTIIVKKTSRIVIRFIAVYGIYIVLFGHLTPGGGFTGGVMLACGLIITMLAFGKDFSDGIFAELGMAVWDCIGALAFLAIALLGYAAGAFFINFLGKGQPFDLFSAGIIPLCNIAIGVKVGACLFGVFAALAVFKRGEAGKE